ncbi:MULTISPECIES: P-loop NTPase family protein [Aerococcus]|uniref:Rad50/SbcC-type AAA domain-containing protein n=1 Tax=Aerococcus loyolae TaxID=2976809 RepID=A0ABT4C1B8_9LACT|nr:MULTISPECIES: hypothetical protein [Aerococcus]MCY3026314.1 hypothetical protein [Aerococcus loyolae]MCY3027246.1 hypothetical protein [Aerococcus loyolae]MCY3028868.1 hypothetical protein [Aerococcus loyolae]MDK6232267.1 hypothetical protein [Aerococcus urinae]MDK6257482.1 hypothetical protein [Aerococcus urinae]
MNVITVAGLTKNFEHKTLFNDFSLTIEQNTAHAIVDPNSSGKTSLPRTLTGLY